MTRKVQDGDFLLVRRHKHSLVRRHHPVTSLGLGREDSYGFCWCMAKAGALSASSSKSGSVLTFTKLVLSASVSPTMV
jgi:hypothetical protein